MISMSFRTMTKTGITQVTGKGLHTGVGKTLTAEAVSEQDIRSRRQFAAIIGQHQVNYGGNAFYIEKGDYVGVPCRQSHCV